MSTSEEARPSSGPDWVAIDESADFAVLRRRLRSFVFPMTAAFLVWYLLYVLLSDYAHDFMSTKVFGNINIGLIFGLLQFVSTFLITGLYVRHANRKLDPVAEKIRHDIEGAESRTDTDVEGGAR